MGPHGNPRMHYVFFLVGEGTNPTVAKRLIPRQFTSTYFGDDAENIQPTYNAGSLTMEDERLRVGQQTDKHWEELFVDFFGM